MNNMDQSFQDYIQPQLKSDEVIIWTHVLKAYGRQDLKLLTGWRGFLSRYWRLIPLTLWVLAMYWKFKLGAFDNIDLSSVFPLFCIGMAIIIGSVFFTKKNTLPSKRHVYHSGFITDQRMIFMDEVLGVRPLSFANIKKAAFDYENGGKAITLTSRRNKEYVLVGNFDYDVALALIEPHISH